MEPEKVFLTATNDRDCNGEINEVYEVDSVHQLMGMAMADGADKFVFGEMGDDRGYYEGKLNETVNEHGGVSYPPGYEWQELPADCEYFCEIYNGRRE